MNRLEFTEILKNVGINTPISTTTVRYGTREDVYCWNDLKIYFGGSYYAVVYGKIPLEVANIISEKYQGKHYNIRVNGGCEEWRPIDWATDDKYEKEIQEYSSQHLDLDEYLVKCQKAKKNFKRRNNSNKYLKTYHIDTKEGLLLFLLEVKDYYMRKKNLPEIAVLKYDELINNVCIELLRKVNPTISAYDWMQGDKENKEIYNFSVTRDSKTKIGQMFRKAILDFDKAVNPFIGDTISIDEMNEFLKKVKINANVYNSENEKNREGCCYLEMIDSRIDSSTSYYRRPNGFSYQLMYKLGDDQYLNVLHYFSINSNNELDKGEVIAINYFGEKTEKNIDIRLNITNGQAGATYLEKNPATLEEIAFVYDELIKAIGYASEITKNNMQKDHKKLVLRND